MVSRAAGQLVAICQVMVGRFPELEALPDGLAAVSPGAEEEERFWQEPKAKPAAAPAIAVCKNCFRFTVEFSDLRYLFFLYFSSQMLTFALHTEGERSFPHH
jgi:hypothetical protein